MSARRSRLHIEALPAKHTDGPENAKVPVRCRSKDFEKGGALGGAMEDSWIDSNPMA